MSNPCLDPRLKIVLNGKEHPNGLWLASAPPTESAEFVIDGFENGWGGAIWKTVTNQGGIFNTKPCLDVWMVPTTDPRAKADIMGLFNIQLISTQKLEEDLHDITIVKNRFPERFLGVSIMEPCRRELWQSTALACIDAGADGIELNFGCPHGMSERGGQGSAIGQNPALCREISSWVQEVAGSIPVLAKQTPNITDICVPGRASLEARIAGLSAVNTFKSLMGMNRRRTAPRPAVKGHSAVGGYSGPAIRPIALAMNQSLGQMIATEFPDAIFSAIGGIETADDALDAFELARATSIQVCTGVMKFGYGIVQPMAEGILAYMEERGFLSMEDFRGQAADRIVTQGKLVEMQSGGATMPASTSNSDIVGHTEALIDRDNA